MIARRVESCAWMARGIFFSFSATGNLMLIGGAIAIAIGIAGWRNQT